MKKFIYKEKLTSQKLNQMVDEIEGKYEKPSNGIPQNDLSEGVKTSLGKADTALQKLSELTSETNKTLSLLETQAKSLDSAVTNIVHSIVDDSALPTLCGQPMILFGEGTPQVSVVPKNWKQYDPETGEGYDWNGLPSAIGQQYINESATANGRYIAVLKNDGILKWINF